MNVRAVAGVLVLITLLAACGSTSDRSVQRASRQPCSDNKISFNTGDWKTDFSRHSVPLCQITSGGPPRDGIPPLDRPKFVSVAEASAWLKPKEPVIQFSLGSDHRAYPLQILIWHEIANDVVGGTPVTVTFCPLCDTAIVFDRRQDGRVLDFGTTGNLRNSDLVMWDRETESWWQQVGGEAIVGQLTGEHLTMLPTSIVSWSTFRDSFPAGRVLSLDTGFERPYGDNPYLGYDRVDSPPFLYKGPSDGRLPPKERVVVVSMNGEAVAYPFQLLQKRRVVTDSVGGMEIVVLFQPGTTSALDQHSIADSADVGATGVFETIGDGMALTIFWRDGAFVDKQTESEWNLLGQAVSGSLAGKHLPPVIHTDTFWFAAAAFNPNTRIFS
jgi:hypothetical protein